jgi:hypothetical protein
MTENDYPFPVPSSEISEPYRERYAELLEIIETFCTEYLNDEYRDACYELAADVCSEGSPVLTGKTLSWAAGLIWAIGRVNFLTDASFEPHMSLKEFAKAIGVSQATIAAKCREIWIGLDLMQMDPDFTVPSLAVSNPLAMVARIVQNLTNQGVLLTNPVPRSPRKK